jgi:glycosyltransferase involved in cell wall biosynthesis
VRISIVTPSLNQGKFIEQAIMSVMNQDHDDIEHIVMDGGSTDETISTLKKYTHLQWVSERDSGQSNAINKGFKKATGEILAWLNSDDYYENNVFGSIVEYFQRHPECMILYGDITFVDRDGIPLSVFAGRTITYEMLIRRPDLLRQPSFFWRRSVWNELGGVDENLHLVMDFDFFLRAAARFGFHHINRNLSHFRYYGGGKSLSRAKQQMDELLSVYKKYNIKIGVPTYWNLLLNYGKVLVRQSPIMRASG